MRRNRRTLDAATRTELIRDALVRNLLTDHWECPEWMGVSYAAPEAKSTHRIEKHVFCERSGGDSKWRGFNAGALTIC